MIPCERFYELLVENGIDFFTGVPDSLLKDFNAYIMDHAEKNRHIIAANEGSSIALAAGHYLATGRIGLTYMQNSGLGNAINPLTSLVDKEVYSIPVLMVIGWRGEPGKKDEPQHAKKGRIMLKLLDSIEIPYEILPSTVPEADASIRKAVQTMRDLKTPYALVVRKGTFEDYRTTNSEPSSYDLSREDAIRLIAGTLNERDIVVSTTGMISRELFEFRESRSQDHSKDFLTVGSMGHSSQLALGISLSKPDQQVYCLDGDGAIIMHMGTLAIIGSQSPENFRHIILNNGAHDSVGGQPTAGFDIDFVSIAKSCGYRAASRAETSEELVKQLTILHKEKGPTMLEVRVSKGHRKDLGRPTTTPIQNKESFMKFLSQ